MTQLKKLLRHFAQGRTITRVEAIVEHRIFNLTARIDELRQDGFDISTRIKRDANGTRYAEYAMAA